LCAGVAQLVEQRIRNAKVTSSIPVIGTNSRPLSPRNKRFRSDKASAVYPLGLFAS
jgi:hypothetical protein